MKNTTLFISRKTIFKFAASLLLGSSVLQTQGQNALSFDGVNDYVNAPAASSLVVGSTNLSLGCWVYPTLAASFEGIAGIRNETDADFYILQFSGTTVEARFRNSTGTYFNIIGTGLVVNTWQYLTLTYDGSMLRFYRNGVLNNSIAASGSISNAAVDFNIGMLSDGFSLYTYQGKVDEVSFWNKTLTASEISCISNSQTDSTDANLLLYYRCNQGAAGGNNTAITSLTDSKGNIDGLFNGLALSGATSNFVAGVANQTIYTTSYTMCSGASYQFGTQTLTAPGTYTETFTTAGGCDSVVQLTLGIGTVNVGVTQNNYILTANQTFAVYQWVNCLNNYSHIAGATSISYNTQGINGSYAVIVSFNGCSDTSNCFNITTGIAENEFASQVSVFPNPVGDVLNIDLNSHYRKIGLIITDVTGKVLLNEKYADTKSIKADVSKWAAGSYLMKLTADDKTAMLKLLKK